MNNRSPRKQIRKPRKAELSSDLDSASRSSTPDSSSSESSSQFLPIYSSPLIVDDSEVSEPPPRIKGALDKVIDSLDFESFVVFANVKNRPAHMKASAVHDNAGRLRLCVNGYSCPRRDDDCPWTHVKFDRDTWNEDDDELYKEVAGTQLAPSPSPPPSPDRRLSDSPPMMGSLPPPLLASNSLPSFPSYSSAFSNYSSYPARPPPYTASGFLVGGVQPSFQSGGYTSGGLYTGPQSHSPRNPWGLHLEDEQKDPSRPPAHLLARELSKLSLRDKRKVKSKQTKQRISPSGVVTPGMSLLPPSPPRWPSTPVDMNLGSIGRPFEMQSHGILVPV
jgi:hypothetical protein